MRILPSRNSAMNAEMGAEIWANTFPRIRHDFDAIKQLREMYRRFEINEALAKRQGATLKRHVAHLPPPVFVWLTLRYPEILRNQNMLREFLRANKHLCLVERL